MSTIVEERFGLYQSLSSSSSSGPSRCTASPLAHCMSCRLHPTWMTFFSPNLGGLRRLSLPRSAEPTQRQRLGSFQNSSVEVCYCCSDVNTGRCSSCRCSSCRCSCPQVPTDGHTRWTHVHYPLQGCASMIPHLQQLTLPCQQDC